MSELNKILDSLRDSTPGPDNINNWFLRHSPTHMRQALLHLANTSLRTGTLPAQHKFADIIPIPKPAKPRNQPSSYRPISLINTISRVIEKLFYERLYYIAETRHWLPHTQSAYRKHHSTIDALISLTTDILTALNHHCSTFFIQIDFSKAFDKVWPKGLLFKLHQFGLRGPFLAWLSDFLSDRKYRVMLPTPTEYTTFDIGTPQGSCLSALLFILYTSDLLNSLHVHHSGFADDTGVWHASNNFTTSINALNQALETVAKWCIKWRLPLSIDKTSYIVFLPKGLKFTPSLFPPITLLGLPVKRVYNPIFLGVILDPGLTWGPHIEYLVSKVERRVNQLKRLLGTPWKHNRQALLNVYKGFVRPALEYASCIWFFAAPSHLIKLDRLQNRALRLIAGGPPSTSAPILQADLKCSSLETRRHTDAITQLHRIQALPWTAPLSLRMFTFIAHSDPKTGKKDPLKHPHFFSQSSKLHHEIYDQPPITTWADPFPSLNPPWDQFPMPTGHSNLSQLKLQLLQEVRRRQNTEYKQDTRTSHLRLTCPDSAEGWVSDLRNYYQSRILFRLRAGHSRLAAHNRTLPNQDACSCGSSQTTEHLLLSCQLLTRARQELFSQLSLLNPNFQPTLTDLLNPPASLPLETRISSLRLVVHFVQSTGVRV